MDILLKIIAIINKYSNKLLPNKISGLIEKYLQPEIIRYLFVGAGSALVFMLGSDLMYYLIPQTIIATALGWLIGVIFSYFAHMRVTFQVEAKHKSYVPKYILLSIINLVYNVVGAWLFHDLIGLGYELSIFIISIIWPLLSYLIMKLFVFTSNNDEHNAG